MKKRTPFLFALATVMITVFSVWHTQRPMEPTWWARWYKASELKKFLGPNRERVLIFY